MDIFGIGAAVKGAARVYFQSARQTGRTTSLVESLKDGDRVVFVDAREAVRVARLCKELGVTIDALVIDPAMPDKVFNLGMSKGRTIFDHAWVEQYYMNAIERCQKDIDHLKREAGGFGMAHVETRLKAREMAKWQI